MHLWLLSYEFSETVITLAKDKIVVLTSNRKKVLLDEMKAPDGYKGVHVEVVLRDPNQDKQAENFDAYIKQALHGIGKKTIGMFSGETLQGNFALQFKEHFKKATNGVPVKDSFAFFQDVMNVKTKD